jgi:hypothetical protein
VGTYWTPKRVSASQEVLGTMELSHSTNIRQPLAHPMSKSEKKFFFRFFNMIFSSEGFRQK